MAETEFSVRFEGPALAGGRMEVRDLAPALLSLAELFREANAIVNPGTPPPSLDIQATASGSFDVGLVLQILDSSVDMLNSEPAQAVVTLRDLVSLPTVGLLWAIKRFRGRQPVRVDEAEPISLPETDTELPAVRVSFAEGDVVEIPQATLDLAQSVVVRRRASEVVAPLQSDGVSSVAIGRSKDTEIEVTTSDVPAFAPIKEPSELLLDETVRMSVEIASPSFDGRKWRVSDGEQTFWADLADEAFVARMESGFERFGVGDILRCRIRVEQTRSESAGLRTERTIVEVTQHIPARTPVQTELIPPEDAD